MKYEIANNIHNKNILKKLLKDKSKMSIKSCLAILNELEKAEEFARFYTNGQQLPNKIILAINQLNDTCQSIGIPMLDYSNNAPDIVLYYQEENLTKIPLQRFLALQNPNNQFSLQLILLLKPTQMIFVQVFRVSLSIPIPGQINVSVLQENPSVTITRIPSPD
jgi:hypothetical protein